MRKAETLLLGEVFQTFDSFSQSLLSLAELPYSRSQTGGFFTAPSWRKLVFLSDRSIEILIDFCLFRRAEEIPLHNERELSNVRAQKNPCDWSTSVFSVSLALSARLD